MILLTTKVYLNKKTFITFLVAFLAILVGGVGYFVIMQKGYPLKAGGTPFVDTPEKPTISPSKILTQSPQQNSSLDQKTPPGWRMYHNEKYGFDLWYPNMWNVNTPNDNHIVFWQKIDLAEDLLQENVFDITISQIPQGLEKAFHDSIEKNSNFSVDNHSAVRTVKSNASALHAEQIELAYSQQLIVITLRSNLSGNVATTSLINKIDETSIFEKILTSFKFNK